MSLNIRTLRHFVQVAELGSMSLAARSLNMAQPALSQAMAGLEDHLGLQLLVRSARGTELTEDGRRLLQHARDILERVRVVEEELGRGSDELHGGVTVGMPAPIANVLVEPLVQRVLTQHPRLRLRIEEARTTALLTGLLAGQLDLVITASASDSRRVESTPLANEHLHLVGSAAAGLTGEVPFSRLFETPLMVSAMMDERRSPIVLQAERLGGHLNIVLESTSLATTKRLVEAGELFAVMTWSAAAQELETGRLSGAKVVDPDFSRPLHLCQARDRRHSRAAQFVAGEIRGIFTELIAAGVIR